jgi:hypothetical protein
LGSSHGITLYERWISTPHGSGALIGTQASVDSQISSRITATRLVAIGIFACAAKKKTGTIYLSIDNPAFASVVEFPPDANSKAREFAVKIMNTARAAEKEAPSRPARIDSAKESLSRVVADTSAISEAESQLAAVEADPGLLQEQRIAAEKLSHAEQVLKDLQAARL